MSEKKKTQFRNFCLGEVTHLEPEEVYNFSGQDNRIRSIKENAEQELEKRLEAGKKLIADYSKPGDLVMFESPEEWTLKTYQKSFNEASIEFWDGIAKRHLNFYHELSEYAKSKGRRVASLDSVITKPGNKFWNLEIRGLLDSTIRRNKLRYDYIVQQERTDVMQSKIQRSKPNLAIMAASHAILLEKRMKPKQTVYATVKLSGVQKATHRFLTAIQKWRFLKIKKTTTKLRASPRKRKQRLKRWKKEMKNRRPF